ncbi:hypothetical protein [Streptomyces sp. NPDC058457]|uniref:hypothetical protein n=1 Tax=Streptomyces sp. NPDC058457 TaxID=3346507 RepID=UPI0036540F18
MLLNAALLGLESYSAVVEEWHRWLRLAEHGCLAVFTVEILLRLGAHADRPRGDAVHAGLEVSRWSLVYYASYVLIASFVLVNVLIGVVITSLDEARQMEQEEATEEPPYPAPGLEVRRLLFTRITAARQALDDLERDLLRRAAADGSPDIGAARAASRS